MSKTRSLVTFRSRPARNILSSEVSIGQLFVDVRVLHEDSQIIALGGLLEGVGINLTSKQGIVSFLQLTIDNLSEAYLQSVSHLIVIGQGIVSSENKCIILSDTQ